MNLLLHLKSRHALLVNTLLLTLSSLLLVAQTGQWWYSLLLLAGIAVLFMARMASRSNDVIHAKIQHLAKELNQGQLDIRITGINPGNRYYNIAWRLNEALDQIETFMREVDTVSQASNNHEFYRTTLPQGLNGHFATALEKFNQSVEAARNSYWGNKQNELFSSLGQLKTENLLRNLAHSQRDLNTISAEMDAVEDISEQSSQNATNSLDNVRTLISDLTRVVDKATAMRDSTQRLSQNSVKISEMVTTISGVADQTNLLALNAAIEAARAGEHGRGFAVVADEVKNLASTTKQAASEINDIMRNFVDATEVMVDDTLNMAEISEKSKQTIGEFESNFTNSAFESQQVHSKVSYVQVICQTALTKIDHLIFMQRAYHATELMHPGDHETAPIAVDAHHCRFGQWYDSGDGQARYSHLPSFAAIQQPHHDVHEQVHKVLHVLQQPDWQTNPQLHDEILRAFNQAEASSTELIGLVENLAQDKMNYEGFASADQETEIEMF